MLKDILEITFLQNSVLDYLIFLAILLVGILVVRIIKSVILRRLKAWAKKTATTIDDFLIRIFEKTLLPLVYFGVLYLATRSLTLNPALTKIIDVSGVILLTIFGIRFVVAIVSYALEAYWLKGEKDETNSAVSKGYSE